MADEKLQEKTTIAAVVEHFSGLAVRIFGFVAGAVGLLYGIGFAVVNISLLHHGVYEVALVRARYVSAGVFCLVFFALLVLGVYSCLFLAEWIVEGRSWVSLASSVILIGGFCCLLALGVGDRGLHNFFSVLSYFLQRFMRGATLRSVWEFGRPLSSHFMIWCLMVSLFVLLFVRRDQIPGVRDLLSHADTSAEGMSSGAERKPAALTASLVLGSLVGIPLLVFFYYYGQSAYATFPAALGGGEPITVQFSAEEESMAALQKLGIDAQAPGLTEEVRLIAQTETRYIVLVRDPALEGDVAVSFEKSFVRGIRYYPKEHYLSDQSIANEYTQEGLADLERAKPEAAIRRFDYALWRMPDHVPAWMGTGDAQLTLKNYQAAIQSYREALRYEPSSGLAQYGLARAYALSKRDYEGVDSLSKAIEADETYREKAKTEAAFEAIRLHPKFVELVFQGPQNAAIWYGLEGEKQREARNWEAAVVEYTRAISLTHQIEDKTGEANYHYRRAGVYLEMDKRQDALDGYNKAVQLEPTNATYRFSLAETYAAQQDFQSARVEYEEARTIKPDYIAAWIGEGDAYLALQDYQTAINRYTEAITLDRKNGGAYYNRARAEALLGKGGEAIQDFHRAIGLDPIYIERAASEPDFDNIRDEMEQVLLAAQYNERGNLLKGEGKLEEALDQYRAALELDPTNAAYYANLGDVYRRLQRPADAVEQYLDAIEYDPQNDSYHYRLAGIYYDQGEFGSAIAEYEAAVAINDKNHVYHSGLGDAYRQEGRLDEAARAYERAIKLDASNVSYHVRLADVYYRQGNLEGAVIKYSEAIRLDEGNPAHHYGLAQVYRAQGKLLEAIQSYQAAIERNPEYGDAYCGLGLAYQKSDQQQDAIEALRQCLEVSQDEELKKQAGEALAELGE